MNAPVSVLTYHSISERPGPTRIPGAMFAMQMEELAGAGVPVLTRDEFLDWRRGARDLPRGGVLITFDDAFADFKETAFPILARHGFTAIMFAPVGKLGGKADWDGEPDPEPLMSWDDLQALSGKGISIEGHGVRHADLTAMDDDALGAELDACKAALADRLGASPRVFAAPFGRVDARVRAAIAQRFEAAFGTRLDRARRDCPLDDIPRIDMHYFRDRRFWRSFLRGDGAYLALRQTLRTVRTALSNRGGGYSYG